MDAPSPNSRTRSALGAGAVFACLGALVAFGCGGNTATSENAEAVFQQTLRTSSLAGYQTMAAVSGYARRAMSESAPAVPSFASTDENGYDDMLGLYVDQGTIAGPTLTHRFYLDQAKTQPAGMMTVTVPGETWDRNYSFYPASVKTHVDVDEGHHAGSGDAEVAYLNDKGDCTVQGSIHLDRNDIDLALNLEVKNQGTEIGGGWTASRNGVAVKMTNLSGTPDGEWTGNLRVDPIGWQGTVKMTPDEGMYEATMDSSKGDITVGVNAQKQMTIAVAGQQIVIDNALAASVTADPNTNGTGNGGASGGGLNSTGSGGLSSTGATGGSTNGESNGGATGETTGTNTTGETTGTTGANTTGETTGTTGVLTTGGFTGSTTGTTSSTGETNGSTSAGTTSAGGTTTTTTGSNTGSTSAGGTTTGSGTTGSGTTTTTGSNTGSTSAGTTGSETTGSTTAGTTGSTSSGTTGTTG